MRFALFDVIVVIAIGTISAALSHSVLPVADPYGRLLVAITSGFVAYVVVSSPLYRWLHLYPLLLPKCPICRDRNRHYWSVQRDWPREVIECAICHSRIGLCLDQSKCGACRSQEIHFCLKWPYSTGGRWRRIQ